MQLADFEKFYTGLARRHLVRAIKDALLEDGTDLTTNAVFTEGREIGAVIVAKECAVIAGLPIASLVLHETGEVEPGEWALIPHVEEGTPVEPGDRILSIEGSARVLLRAERVILNFLTHLSGIATLTRAYVQELEGTGVRLLDTRKTLPGLRYPEKYAVLVGGGHNHRLNLGDMLMLKDNHIDAVGGVLPAVEHLRTVYADTIPIEVECRTLEQVRTAVVCGVSRIMLDNMTPVTAKGALDPVGLAQLEQALALIPTLIEVEISGGVSLENIGTIARACSGRKPDFISVGRLTHSAPAADLSMLITV